MAQWRKVVVSGSSPEFSVVSASSDIYATGNVKTIGDLTVAGGDIVLGTTSIFSGGNTTSLNNIDAIDATTEATIESAIDTLSNLTTVGALDAGSITSGFTSIDVGSGAITTTGTISGATGTYTGTISGSAVYGTTIGQNRVDGVKTITIEANSTINQDVTSDASPQFTGIELGHGSDTTITRASAGDLNVEGNVVYRAGGTDVPVADGGTGASTLTDGGILLGSGTGAITATAVLGDGEILIGDGSGDPVALDIGSSTAITTLGTIATGTWEATDVAVAHGGTGASTFTDGGVLLGSGTGAITATAVLGDGEILIGDGTTDPVALDIGSSTAITTLGTIATGVWNGTALTGTYIANDTIDSAHYAAGSIDNEHLADDAVDSDELAAGAVDDAHLSDGVATGLAGAGTTATSGVLNVIGGNGITANANDVAVTAAQTTITSIYNTALKVGSAASQEYVDFSTTNEVNTKINNSEILSVTATGVDVTGAVTISGNLDVNGSLTTIDSTNLRVADRFIYASSGSTSGDGGLIIGTGANGIGTAIGYDDSVKRWGLSKEDDTAHDATAITPRQYVVSVSGSATSPGATPSDFGTAAGDRIGMMHVNTNDGEIWIYS